MRDAPAPHKTMLQEQLRMARAEALQSQIAWLARQGRWNEAQRQFEQMRDAAAGADASAPVQISLLAQHALAARTLGLLREEEELMNRLPVPLSRAMESGQWPAALDALRPWARGMPARWPRPKPGYAAWGWWCCAEGLFKAWPRTWPAGRTVSPTYFATVSIA